MDRRKDALPLARETARNKIYFAAVCRCFPGKCPGGGDRVPSEKEVQECSHWLKREFELLQPTLILPVGRLAISQFLPVDSLAGVIGKIWQIRYHGSLRDVVPLPHPSGASPWHRMEPGKTLLERALRLIAAHPATRNA
jgi:uracil-DNA glycosylase